MKSPQLVAVPLLGLAAIIAFAFDHKNALGTEPIAKLIGREGNTGVLVIALGLLLAFAWRHKDRALALWVVAVMLVETALYGALKAITWHGFHVLARPSGGDGGFPSGHTAAHVCLAYILTERYPKLAPLWWFWAALMAWSRVESGAHFAYQTLAGMVLGGLVCLTLGQKLRPPPEA
ncbi:phosphatase PAP2 family protein [Armatimonas sp.]|uniref:phosphatase PAP2 family protein n=1 Tax=Armatimonas sp. TaxID=1872638 RepID=UPI00286A3D13|nr:phosphatase PAP2 family protein [Armatimonas sp.]